jgi:hypothetical protein
MALSVTLAVDADLDHVHLERRVLVVNADAPAIFETFTPDRLRCDPCGTLLATPLIGDGGQRNAGLLNQIRGDRHRK